MGRKSCAATQLEASRSLTTVYVDQRPSFNIFITIVLRPFIRRSFTVVIRHVINRERSFPSFVYDDRNPHTGSRNSFLVKRRILCLLFNTKAMPSFRAIFNTFTTVYEGISMIYGGRNLRPGSMSKKEFSQSSVLAHHSCNLDDRFSVDEQSRSTSDGISSVVHGLDVCLDFF